MTLGAPGSSTLPPFAALTDRGKLRRLALLARQALTLYNLEPRRLSLLKSSWNTTFRVDAADGRRYALRISRPGVRDLLLIHSELTWMDALARDTDIPIPAPLRSTSGALVTEVSLPSVGGPRYVSIFNWMGGRHTRGTPSETLIETLGETMARLHEHAESFRPPEHFTHRRFDRVGTFARRSDRSGLDPHPVLTPERLTLFGRARDRVHEEMDRLFGGPSPPRFLHLDMHLGNVKMVDRRMAVLDFDDSMWAYPMQDIAITLYYLRYGRGWTADWQTPLRRGYERRRAWPEEWDGQLRLLTMARALDLVDVYLESDHPVIRQRLPQLIAGVEEQISNLSSE